MITSIHHHNDEKNTGCVLVIGTGYNNVKPKGWFSWSYQTVGLSKVVVPPDLSLHTVQRGVLYFTKADDKARKALCLHFTSLNRTDSYFKVEYICGEELPYTSYEVKHAIKKLLRVASVYDLPYCVDVEEHLLLEALRTEHLATLFRFYTEKCKWDEIVKCVGEMGPLETTALWNDSTVLQYVAFALAKLGECTINVRRLYRDDRERKMFIAEKRRYREEAIRIRKRLCELEPENLSHVANLAYSHYLSAIELTIPGGRRDGDAEKEAYTALAYYRNLLQGAPHRIPDAYRAGQLLTRILPKLLLYAQNDPATKASRVEQATTLRVQGIDILEKAIATFDQLTDANERTRMQKYYVKALYILAHAYLQRGKCTFLIAEKTIRAYCQQPIPKQRFLYLASQAIDRCILEDARGKVNQERILEYNGWICGAFKAYTKGVIHMYLYALTLDETHKNQAYDHLQRACEISFPKELRNQQRLFVLEKLAILSLLTGNSTQAAQYLEPYYRRNEKTMPDYCLSTLAVSYILNGKYHDAILLCDTVLSKGKTMMSEKFMRLKDYAEKRKGEVEFEVNEEERIGDEGEEST